MTGVASTIELPDDLLAFAEEQVRVGRNTSVAEVVREAVEDKRRMVLRAAIDEGLAELDAGLGVECTPEEMMDGVFEGLGLSRKP